MTSLYSHLTKLRKSKRYRYEQNRLIVSTEKIIREIAPSTTIHTLLLSKEAEEPAFKAKEIIRVDADVLERVSGLKTTTDMVAEVDLPPPRPLEGVHRLLVLDRLTDPGNVGTLLRSALAFAWDGVFLLEGSVDPFNEKALRASRGALFRLPYQWGSESELLSLLEGFDVYVADIEGRALEPSLATDRLALILGREASGPTAHLKERAEALTIPMPGEMESLNVAIAGSILMHTLAVRPALPKRL